MILNLKTSIVVSEVLYHVVRLACNWRQYPNASIAELNALPPGTILRDYVIKSELGSGGRACNERRGVSGGIDGIVRFG